MGQPQSSYMVPKVGQVQRSWRRDCTRRPTGPPPEKGLDVMLELLGEVTQEGVTIDLAPKPEKGFTLCDSVYFQGVTRDTHSHEGPEFNPLVAFRPNSSLEGVVVGGLDWS